ncbi:MAG: hypothetical protein LC722_01140 [Actinobacteria bacterium]|nr:hypothetical protein [Actinomycetota bacterium]
MQYAQAVAEGKALLARGEESQWELARLTWYWTKEAKPPVKLNVWATDVGISVPHASIMRKTWKLYHEVWDRKLSAGRTFNEYYVLAGKGDRGRAEELLRDAEDSGGNVGTRERKRSDGVDRARDVIRDHESRRKFFDDPEVKDILEREWGPRVRREQEPDHEGGEQLQLDFADELAEMGAQAEALFERLRAADLAEKQKKGLDRKIVAIEKRFEQMHAFLFPEPVRRREEDTSDPTLDVPPPPSTDDPPATDPAAGDRGATDSQQPRGGKERRDNGDGRAARIPDSRSST